MTPRELAANAELLEQQAAAVRAYASSHPENEIAASPEYHQRKARLTAEFTSDLAADTAALVRDLAVYQSSTPDADDGPVPPDGFRFQGTVHRGLQPKPWQFLSFLWLQADRAGELDETAAHVMQDKEAIYDREPHSWCKRLNAFFREHRIPFHATIKTRVRQAAIIDGAPKQVRKARPAKKPKKPTNRP